MLRFSPEIIARFVGARKQEAESQTAFESRIRTMMKVSRTTYHLLHKTLYHSLTIKLKEYHADPVATNLAYMKQCPEIMRSLRHLAIEGLVEWNYDESTFHQISLAEIQEIVLLAPNLISLSLSYLDIVSPHHGLSQTMLIPYQRDNATPTNRVAALSTRWTRLSSGATLDFLCRLFPNLTTINTSHAYWAASPVLYLPEAAISPITATLIDLHPNSPPSFLHPLQYDLPPGLSNGSFGKNLLYLHLGTNDEFHDQIDQFLTWYDVPMDTLVRLSTLAFSISLGPMGRQKSSPDFLEVVSTLISRATKATTRIELHLLASSMVGTYPDASLTSSEWEDLEVVCLAHGHIDTLSVTFVDSDTLPVRFIPLNYITPLRSAFRNSDIALKYNYIKRHVWAATIHKAPICASCV